MGDVGPVMRQRGTGRQRGDWRSYPSIRPDRRPVPYNFNILSRVVNIPEKMSRADHANKREKKTNISILSFASIRVIRRPKNSSPPYEGGVAAASADGVV